MIRFITNILLISTFFIGLGAIGDGILKAIRPNQNQFVFEQKLDCDKRKIKVVKIESNSDEHHQFQVILPNTDELQKIQEPIAQRKFVILRQSEIIE